VLVICESHSGQQTHQTAVQKGTLNPVWQEAVTFSEVATTDMLIVQLWDHKKFTSNVCMGEVGPLSLSRHTGTNKPPMPSPHPPCMLPINECRAHVTPPH